MRKSNLIKQLVVFFILFLHISSCEYEPKGQFESDIDLESFDLEILLESSLLTEDTITIWKEDVSIDYKFSSSNYEITEVEFFLNGEQIYLPGIDENVIRNFYSKEGELYISLDEIEEGYNKLTAKVTGVSGSGSIADCKNLEVDVEEFEWIIIAHKEERKPYSFSIENKQLKLIWRSYFWGHKNYIVEKYCGDILVDSFTSEDNTIIDASYVGERAIYKVYVVFHDGTKQELYRIDKDNELPELKMYGNKLNEQFIYWHPSNNYSALKEYVIGCYDTQGVIRFKGVVGVNDTIIKINEDKYGVINKVMMTLYPIDNDLSDSDLRDRFRKEMYMRMGSRINKDIYQENGIFPLHSNLFLLRDLSHMYIFSPSEETNVVLPFDYDRGCYPDEFIKLKISPDGKRFLFVSSQCSKYHLYNYVEGSDEYRHLVLDRDEDLIWCYDFEAIYNNLIMLESHEYGNVLFDLQEKEIVGEYNEINNGNITFSSDGNYVICRGVYDQLYKLENGKLNQLYQSPYRVIYKEFEFHKMFPGKVVCVEEDKVVLRNINNFSISNSYSISGEEVMSVDTEYNQLFTIKDGKSIIRNLLNGNRIKEFDFAYKDSKLYGNIFYDNTGLLYYINE